MTKFEQLKDVLENIITGCREVKLEDSIHKDAKDLSALVIKDCSKAIKILEGKNETNESL
jgi:hypothetical protein